MIIFGTADGREWEATYEGWDVSMFANRIQHGGAHITARNWKAMEHLYYINPAQVVWWRDADA